MLVLRNKIQGKPRLYPLGLLEKRVHQGSRKTVTELKEAIGKDIITIGSKVTKAVIDSYEQMVIT